jgi:hypothetical protein
LPEADAQNRVDAAVNEARDLEIKAREQADKARRAAIVTGFIAAASLLISLVAACCCASIRAPPRRGRSPVSRSSLLVRAYVRTATSQALALRYLPNNSCRASALSMGNCRHGIKIFGIDGEDLRSEPIERKHTRSAARTDRALSFDYHPSRLADVACEHICQLGAEGIVSKN